MNMNAEASLPRYVRFILWIMAESPRRRLSKLNEWLLLFAFLGSVVAWGAIMEWNVVVGLGVVLFAVAATTFTVGLYWFHPGMTHGNQAQLTDSVSLIKMPFIAVALALVQTGLDAIVNPGQAHFWSNLGLYALVLTVLLIVPIFPPFLLGRYIARRRLAVNG